jgi:hypothetical protein
MTSSIRIGAPLRALVLVIAAIALLAVPTVASAKGKDGDRDGMPTKWEKKNRLNPRKNDAKRDKDHDGLVNIAEYRSHTKAGVKDSDRDGLRDAKEDPDRDKLVNRAEYLTGNNPLDADTDDDGVKDAAEGAGVVTSYRDGTLSLKLFSGGTLTGRVGRDASRSCDSSGDDEDDTDTDDGEPDPVNEPTPPDRVIIGEEGEPGYTGDPEVPPDTGADDEDEDDPDYDPSADEPDIVWGDECGADKFVAGAVVVEFTYSQGAGRANFTYVKFAK